MQPRGPSDLSWVRSGGTLRQPAPFYLAPDARDDLASALAVALGHWARVSGFRATLTRERVSPGNDAKHTVFLVTEGPWPFTPGALAETRITPTGQGNEVDADIFLNGVDYRFAHQRSPRDEGTFDLQAVLTHEVGHALGLAHSNVPGATMAAAYPTDSAGLAWRSLEADDIEGARALYPGMGLRMCDPNVACPSGYTCVAHQCQLQAAYGDLCAPCAPISGACAAAGAAARCVDLGALSGGAGLVCGRPCEGPADCGDGFTCQATTEAGDRQCVPARGAPDVAGTCRGGPWPCQGDSTCPIGRCIDGFCQGQRDAGTAADAGASSPDAHRAPGAGEVGGGCHATSQPQVGEPGVATLLSAGLLFACLARRRRRPATFSR